MFGIMVAPKQVLYQMEKGDIVDSLTVINRVQGSLPTPSGT